MHLHHLVEITNDSNNSENDVWVNKRDLVVYDFDAPNGHKPRGQLNH